MHLKTTEGLATLLESFVFAPYRPISHRAVRRRVYDHDIDLMLDTGPAYDLSALFGKPVTLNTLNDVYLVYLGEKHLPRGLMLFNGKGKVLGHSSMGASPDILRNLLTESTVESVQKGFFAGDRFTLGNMCHVAFDHAWRAHIAEDYTYPSDELYFFDTSWTWSRELLSTLFGEVNYLRSRTIYHFSHLGYFSNLTAERDVFLHPLAQFDCGFIHRVRQHIDGFCQEPPEGRKLYINRLDANARKIANESEIIRNLEARGFESHAPESMTFKEQLSLFRNAREIIAPHGAGLTNIIASEIGTRISEIFLDDQGTRAYETMSQRLGMDYHRIDVTTDRSGVNLNEFSRLISNR